VNAQGFDGCCGFSAHLLLLLLSASGVRAAGCAVVAPKTPQAGTRMRSLLVVELNLKNRFKRGISRSKIAGDACEKVGTPMRAKKTGLG